MYVDANVIVFAMTDSGSKSRAALELFDEIEHGRRAVTSPLVIDEVIWILRKQKLSQEFITTVINEIYEIPNLEVKEIPAFIPLQALSIMNAHKLMPRDAFHVALMEHFNIVEIASDDKDFDRIPGIKRIKL